MPLDITKNEVVAGELAMSGIEDAARTGYNAEVTDTIVPGVFVAIATGREGNLERRGLVLPIAGVPIVGVCKKSMLNPAGSKPREQVAYFVRGYVGIPVVVAVKSGDPVFATVIAGPNKGRASNVAGAGPDAVSVPGCRFLSTTPAGGVAIVTLNIP